MSKRLNTLAPFGAASGYEPAVFRAGNPTIGTGIAQAITTAYSATAGLLTLRNNAANGNKSVIPLRLRLIPTVAPASATRSELAIAVDDITRYSSGGSAIATLASPSMPESRTSEAVLHFGALTLAAAGANQRIAARAQMRAAIPVAFEEYVIQFGNGDAQQSTLGGATAVRNLVNVTHVVLGKGHSMCVHVWHPGNAVTPASWEFELTWAEVEA